MNTEYMLQYVAHWKLTQMAGMMLHRRTSRCKWLKDLLVLHGNNVGGAFRLVCLHLIGWTLNRACRLRETLRIQRSIDFCFSQDIEFAFLVQTGNSLSRRLNLLPRRVTWFSPKIAWWNNISLTKLRIIHISKY